MINTFYGSEREYGNCEPSDTIGEVASYTHYTAYELCDIIDGIVKGRLKAVKIAEREVENERKTACYINGGDCKLTTKPSWGVKKVDCDYIGGKKK